MTISVIAQDASREAAVASYAVFDRRGHIDGLDGIRALSVLTVMVAHFGFANVVPGGLGVTVFFFLSGFLITSLLTQEFDRDQEIDVRSFYARRIIRLGPELLIMMVLSGLLTATYRPAELEDVLGGLFYFTNYLSLHNEAYGDGSTRWPHLWSLAVEEHYYLTFPLALSFLLKRRGAVLPALLSVCAAVLLWRVYVVTHGAPFGFRQDSEWNPYTYAASEARIDSIMFGALTAIVFARWGEALAKAPRMALLAGMVGLVGLLASIVARGDVFRETVRYTMQGVALSGIFFCLFFSPIGRFCRQRVLEWSPLRRMGRLSYAAYLWHLEFAFLVEHAFRPMDELPLPQRLALAVVGGAITFGMAELSGRIAAPALRLRHHFRSSAA